MISSAVILKSCAATWGSDRSESGLTRRVTFFKSTDFNVMISIRRVILALDISADKEVRKKSDSTSTCWRKNRAILAKTESGDMSDIVICKLRLWRQNLSTPSHHDFSLLPFNWNITAQLSMSKANANFLIFSCRAWNMFVFVNKVIYYSQSTDIEPEENKHVDLFLLSHPAACPPH